MNVSGTIWKQETVSVHQALNKEFLVDDTAIATHQISNKLDQLEKLVKKGESKSGHTLGKRVLPGIVSIVDRTDGTMNLNRPYLEFIYCFSETNSRNWYRK